MFRNENANATAACPSAEEPNRLARNVDERKRSSSERAARNVLEILLRLREKRSGNRVALRETSRKNGEVGKNSENGENKHKYCHFNLSNKIKRFYLISDCKAKQKKRTCKDKVENLEFPAELKPFSVACICKTEAYEKGGVCGVEYV